jgi:hypothetical protein
MTTGFAVRPITTGFIYDPLTGHNFARLDSVGDIYSCDIEGNEAKMATATRDGKLYDLDGNFTGLYLRDLHGPAGENDGGSFARIDTHLDEKSAGRPPQAAGLVETVSIWSFMRPLRHRSCPRPA